MAISTRDTTRIDELLVGVLAACLSAASMLYALKFVEPAWQLAAIEPRYASVVKGNIPDNVDLDALARSLRATGATSDLNRAAFVQMLISQKMGLQSYHATNRLASAQRDLHLGLTAAPADAFAWSRLAVAQMELGSAREAATALSVAMQLAPSDRVLAPLHFDLAVVLWDKLDRTARASLAQRLKWAAQIPELKNASEGNSAMALRQKLAQP